MIEKLVKKAQKGDTEAFGKLIIILQEDLYKIARSRLKQEADIQDAVQDTIVTAFQTIKTLSKISAFKTWIIKILINKCNDIYKKQCKFNNLSFEENELENYFPDDTQNYSSLEFDNLLEMLNYDEKLILILYYAEGYNSKEIAQILDINKNTVRSKILRAKNKIKDTLKEVL